MKKFLLTLLAVIVIVGVLAGVGFAGFRIGYNNAATGTGNVPAVGRYYHMDPDRMPMYRYNEGFGSRMMPYGAPMMGRGGFGFFSPLHFLWNILVIGLIVWFVYWLFTKSGWRITREKTENTSPKTEG